MMIVTSEEWKKKNSPRRTEVRGGMDATENALVLVAAASTSAHATSCANTGRHKFCFSFQARKIDRSATAIDRNGIAMAALA